MNLSETDFVIIFSTFIILIVVLMMVSIYGIFIKKKSELLLYQQKKEASFEQELSISQIEIKEQTLNYIGQELHDDLGQKLSVARLMTNKILFSDGGEEKTITREINELLGECIQDIRNLSKIFITKQVEHFGLIDSVEREIHRIERLELLAVHSRINDRNFEMNPDHEVILFRIVQECINNVIKHSKSNSVELIIENQQKFIEVSVNDKGIGFSKSKSNDGSGLKNMMFRAKIIGAEFHISSVPDEGTSILIRYNKQQT